MQGEFIVPDLPVHTVIPLDPKHCLVSPAPNAAITEENVADINRKISDASQSYFFARDLSKSSF